MSKYYPRGKLNESDQGATAIFIGVAKDAVIMDFGKDVKWIGFDRIQALEIARVIIEKANSIPTKSGDIN